MLIVGERECGWLKVLLVQGDGKGDVATHVAQAIITEHSPVTTAPVAIALVAAAIVTNANHAATCFGATCFGAAAVEGTKAIKRFGERWRRAHKPSSQGARWLESGLDYPRTKAAAIR